MVIKDLSNDINTTLRELSLNLTGRFHHLIRKFKIFSRSKSPYSFSTGESKNVSTFAGLWNKKCVIDTQN